jgi:serine O-acetyltransferase
MILSDYKSYKEFYKYKSRLPFIQILMTPGFLLVLNYRVYSYIYSKGGFFRFIGRFLWLITYFLFGCDINPRSKIQGVSILPHPIGVVIGEGVILKDKNVVYQNVTLGINKGIYPTLSNCIVYSGAVVCSDVDLKNKKISALSLVLNTNDLNDIIK